MAWSQNVLQARRRSQPDEVERVKGLCRGVVAVNGVERDEIEKIRWFW